MTQPPHGDAFPPPSGPPAGTGQPGGPFTPPPAAGWGPGPGPGQPTSGPPAGSFPPPAQGAPYPPDGPYQPAQYPPGAQYQPGAQYPPGAPYQPGGAPAPGAAARPRKKRGLLIASIALAVALVLCGGGGAAAFFLLRTAETGDGAAEPATAVQDLLTAVYQERNVDDALAVVCSSARDRAKVAAKVAEVEKYAEGQESARFKWTTPKVDERTEERAMVSTKVTMTTADEKIAEQDLRFTVVRKSGWWVCEVG